MSDTAFQTKFRNEFIAGFEKPDEGNIFIENTLVSNSLKVVPPYRREFGMVFQDLALWPHMTVSQNISFGLENLKWSKSDITNRVLELTELLKIDEFLDRYPAELSGGQQQRVALARALVMEPKVLLMDEPLSNLDAKLREQMRAEIRRIQQEISITSVYVTHDQVEAMTISDRIVVMNEGRIEQVGTPTETYRHPQSRFVADFIGRANFVNGTVLSQLDGKVVIDIMGQRLTVDAAQDDYTTDAEVTVVVRPEMMNLNPPNPHVEGVVRRAAYLGDVVEYDVEVHGQLLALVENDPRH